MESACALPLENFAQRVHSNILTYSPFLVFIALAVISGNGIYLLFLPFMLLGPFAPHPRTMWWIVLFSLVFIYFTDLSNNQGLTEIFSDDEDFRKEEESTLEELQKRFNEPDQLQEGENIDSEISKPLHVEELEIEYEKQETGELDIEYEKQETGELDIEYKQQETGELEIENKKQEEETVESMNNSSVSGF